MSRGQGQRWWRDLLGRLGEVGGGRARRTDGGDPGADRQRAAVGDGWGLDSDALFGPAPAGAPATRREVPLRWVRRAGHWRLHGTVLPAPPPRQRDSGH